MCLPGAAKGTQQPFSGHVQTADSCQGLSCSEDKHPQILDPLDQGRSGEKWYPSLLIFSFPQDTLKTKNMKLPI